MYTDSISTISVILHFFQDNFYCIHMRAPTMYVHVLGKFTFYVCKYLNTGRKIEHRCMCI